MKNWGRWQKRRIKGGFFFAKAIQSGILAASHFGTEKQTDFSREADSSNRESAFLFLRPVALAWATKKCKGQSTFEYFVIFVAITALAIPLLSGTFFSSVKEAGKEVFDVCVNRIASDVGPGEPQGPADVQLEYFCFTDPEDCSWQEVPFGDYRIWFGLTVMDNTCDEITFTFYDIAGDKKAEVTLVDLAPGRHGYFIAEIDFELYANVQLAPGNYSWTASAAGDVVDPKNGNLTFEYGYHYDL